MKMGIAALIVLIILFILLTTFNIYIEKTAQTIISTIAETRNYIKENNFTKAADNFKKAKEIWENKERIYELQVEQTSLDEINIIFSELEALIKEENYKQYILASYKLASLLEHIINENKVNLETIL